MINESNAIMEAIKKTIEIYGIDYIKKNINCPFCKSYNNKIMTVSFLYEDSSQRKDLKPDFLGWCVFCTIDIDMETGKTEIVDGILPNGKRIKEDK